MDNDERDQNEQIHSIDEYDYNNEPPLDHATTSANRGRSKYVFMTLCFLLALVMLYVYVTGMFATAGSRDLFSLFAAIVLAIMGFVFLKSPDSPPEQQPSFEAISTAPDAQAKPLSPFEELVQEALATIPAEFHEKMDNVMVRVAYEPDEETLEHVGIYEGHTLLGLYEGVPLTTYGRNHAPYPEVITIYQRTIEDYCRHNPTRIREQVRSTVLHEVAHHFGMGHEEMPIWVK